MEKLVQEQGLHGSAVNSMSCGATAESTMSHRPPGVPARSENHI